MFGMLYRAAVDVKNYCYNRRFFEINRSRLPIVSVGAISVGGAGKTPMTAAVIEMIAKRFSVKTALLSRGYRRRTKGFVQVSDGNGNIFLDVQSSGDELYMLAQKHPNLIAVADENRSRGADWIESHSNADVVILDDGFQHRRLHRDIDIVLLDALSLRQKRTLPFGKLREPFPALHRATHICFREDVSEIDAHLFVKSHGLDKKKLLFSVNEYCIKTVVETNSGIANASPIAAVGICGIANPQRFFDAANSFFEIVDDKRFSDHKDYTLSDISDIVEICGNKHVSAIATTEKDWVKLEQFTEFFRQKNISVYLLEIKMRLLNDEILYNDLLNILQ